MEEEKITPVVESPKKELTIRINSQMFFSILLVVLVVVSVAQTVQLVALKRTVATGIFTVQPANAASPSTNGALPAMVGGC